MNLKGFHIVFIAASILLSAMLGAWCVRRYLEHEGILTLAAAAVSFVTAGALVLYGSWFLRKTRHMAVIAALLLLSGGRAAHACQTCFGAEDSPLIDGAKFGAWALIAITVGMQGAFAAFFLYLRKRAKVAASAEIDDEWHRLQRKDNARY